jgi:hypothetical protein
MDASTELSPEVLRQVAGTVDDERLSALLRDAAEKITAAKSAPQISHAQIFALARAQALAAEMWIRQHEQYRDVSSARNTAMAIGKFSGIIMLVDEEELPPDLQDHVARFTKVWERM